MNIEKLTLEERLDRLNGNCPAHNEYIPAVFKSFANQTIGKYFSGIDGLDSYFAGLSKYTHIPEDELKEMRYADFVRTAYFAYENDEVANIVNILARPIVAYYESYLKRKQGGKQ